MESVLALLLNLIAPVMSALKRAWLHFKPKLGSQKLPRDVLDHVHPYVTRDLVQAKLGNAKYVNGKFESYPFSDAALQLLYSDDGAVETVAIVAFKVSKFRFSPLPIAPLDYKLGKMSFGDVWDEGTHPKKDYSSKHWSLHVDQYSGNPGKYWNWRFGVYSGGGAHCTEFRYDYKLDKFRCDPKSILINWVEVSSSESEFTLAEFSTFT